MIAINALRNLLDNAVNDVFEAVDSRTLRADDVWARSVPLMKLAYDHEDAEAAAAYGAAAERLQELARRLYDEPHCECCHATFDPDAPAAWVSGSICGTCNADGCSPGCYAFDLADEPCVVCGGSKTVVQ